MRWYWAIVFLSTGACSSASNSSDDGIAAGGDMSGATGSGGAKGGATSASGGSAGASGGTGGGAAGAGEVAGAGGAGGKSGAGGSSGSSGSSAGNGGSGGAGGGAPHVVGKCDGLGAVNAFETITPPGIVFVGSIAVDPVNSGTIYVGSGSNAGTAGAAQGIWKSTDCGASWTMISTGMNNANFKSGTCYGITLDYVEPQVLYAAMLYGQDNALYKTTNGGVDWTSLFPKGSEIASTVDYTFSQEYSIDPTDHQHVAITFHADCHGKYAPMCLGETHDSGATWHLMKGPLSGWGENARPYVIGPKALLFIGYGEAYYTADSSVDAPTWQKITNGGGHVYRAKNGAYYMPSYGGVYKSANAGVTWSLIQGTPQGYAVSGDGTRIFIGGNVANNYYAATESDDSKWTKLTAPSTPDQYITFDYDAGHHLLYSANHVSGLLRMVTQ